MQIFSCARFRILASGNYCGVDPIKPIVRAHQTAGIHKDHRTQEMRLEIEGRLVATQSATIVYRGRFRPDVDQPSGKQTGNPTASGQVSHPGPSTFHEQLQFAKCVIPRLLLVCDDELIDDGFDIVNIAHELLDGERLFRLAYTALQPDPPALPFDRDACVRKAPIRENGLLDPRNYFPCRTNRHWEGGSARNENNWFRVPPASQIVD